jgi:hypothetical protein
MRISFKQKQQHKHSSQIMNSDYLESLRMDHAELSDELSIGGKPSASANKNPLDLNRR